MALLRPILARCLKHPKRTAVVGDTASLTYLRLFAGSFYMARHIARATSKPHIGLMLPTSGAFPLALLGAWQAGKVVVPLNYLLSKEDLHHVIADAELDTIITVDKLLDAVGHDMIPEGVKAVKFEELSFKGIPPIRWPAKPKDEALAMLLYTSGTSGRPKGVMLSHGALQANVTGVIEHAELTEADTFLGVLPQFHAFGVTALTLLPLFLGAKVVYTARFIPRKLIDLLRQHKPDIFIAVPSMLGALLSVKNATAEDYACLSYAVCGAEPLPQSIYDAFKERYQLGLLEGYGLTETAPVTNWSTPKKSRLHSVGMSLPGVRNFIVDEQNNLLGPDEEGEILISGPNVMMGYWHLPEQTESVMQYLEVPGEKEPVRAFRTGDIGKLDAEGFLYITGRKKEMLIVGGENVFPREIEEVLNQHPSVKASAVIGKPDDMRGEVPIGFVEIEDDSTFDDTALRNHCREHLAQFKVPRDIRQLDELPRNPTGKILRRELKAE